MMTSIELHIGELVLHGVPYGQRDHIAAAIEAELRRLLDERGLPPSLEGGATLPEVEVDDLQVTAGAKPGAVGAQIGGSIYSSLGGNRPMPSLPDRSRI